MKTYVRFWYHQAEFFLDWEMLYTKFVEEIKHTFDNQFFFRKSCRLWGNVDKYSRARQATDDNMAHAHCMLNTWSCRRTLSEHVICNIHCFCTATVVARTRLNATLYVQCLSCYVHRLPPSSHLPRYHLLLIHTKQKNFSRRICPDSSVGSDSPRDGQSRDRSPAGARFCATVQTSPRVHPASCAVGTGSFPGLKQPWCSVDHPPNLAIRLKKE
jgi:hypothetical protein